ncbi:non-ribosomal peptide synthetase [Maritalea myrionectae]|uniref:non-ribosomal peptide synthetase n=1 Tax=Maritalea myrionectae TaxID=454601 RepID=UPI0004018BCB|nr:non-ribosomal peptide synthetase [Maritalea myrionectae]
MVLELLRQAKAEGIQLYVEAGKLKFRARTQPPSDDLRQAIMGHKSDLIAFFEDHTPSQQNEGPLAENPMAAAPLSQTQRRVFYQETAFDLQDTYVLRAAYRFDGQLDAQRLQRALNDILDRHTILRSQFTLDDAGEATQTPLADVELALDVQDDLDFDTWLTAQMAVPLDIGNGMVCYAGLLRHQDASYLFFAFHHLVFDGWSFDCFYKELSALYGINEGQNLPELPFQYGDFARWQGGKDWSNKSRQYWQEQLDGASILNTIKPDHARPSQASFSGRLLTVPVERKSLDGLRALARECECSLYSVMLAAFCVVVVRYSQTEDCVIGTPVAGRRGAKLDDLIGFFANMVPLRVQTDHQLSFRDLIRRVHKTNLAAQAHQDLHFERIIDQLGFAGEASFTPLTQLIFSLAEEAETCPILDGKKGARIDLDAYHLGFEIELHLTGTSDGGLVANWLYADRLFEQETIESIAQTYAYALECLTSEPDQKLAKVALVAPELQENWDAINSVSAPYPLKLGFADLFEKQVEKTPDANACAWLGKDGAVQQLSYADLNARANGLASQLIANGAQVGSRVGIFVGHEADNLIALIAVQKFGGAYVVLDSNNPAARNEQIIQDTECTHLIGTAQQFVDFPQTICVEPDGRNEAQSPSRAGNGWHSEMLAVFVFTSGSTGRPKGSALPASALTNLIFASKERLGFASGQCFGVASTLTFDAHLFEIYVALAFGGAIALFEPTRFRDGKLLNQDQELLAVDYLFATPTTWQYLLDDGWCPKAQQTIISGGEALSDQLKSKLYTANRDICLINIYGPCECTGYVLASTLSDGEDVHVGEPLPNTGAHVLDAYGNPCPAHCEGELVLSGAQVGLYYLNNERLTAERFGKLNVGGRTVRTYATGDVAKRCADGTIKIIGRRDFQVKINGVRIELEEVETALMHHEAVSQAAVIANALPDGSKQLLAYVQTTLEPVQASSVLTRFLAENLPPSFMPAHYILLDEMPLTSSGKINRKALPAADITQEVQLGTAPRNRAEQDLCALWSKLLERDVVDVRASFFALGGYSLLAIKMLNQVNKHFGSQLALRDVIKNLTIEAIASALDANQTNAGAVSTNIERQDLSQPLPLSFSQERMWAIDQIDAHGRFYTIPLVFEIDGEFDLDRLAAFFDQFVEENPILHTTYLQKADHAYQQVLPFKPGVLSVSDMRQSQDMPSHLADLEDRILNAPFDLSSGQIFRAALAILSEEKSRLFIAVHHIAFDGKSVGIFIDQLKAFFNGSSQVADANLNFADIAVWQHDHYDGDQDLAYWVDRLEDAPQLHQLPLDAARPAQPSHKGQTISAALSEEVSSKLDALAARLGVTEFATLFDAFAAYLCHVQGQADIVIGTAVANRERDAFEGIIGNFVNSVALRVQPDFSASFSDFLRAAHAQFQEDMAHQSLPFEKLVDRLQPGRSFAHSPIFQIMMVQDNSESGAIDLGGAQMRMIDPVETEAKFDLSVGVRRGDVISFNINFATDIFDASRIQNLTEGFVDFLEKAVAEPAASLDQLLPLTKLEPALFGPKADINATPFIERFAYWVQMEGDATAIRFEGQSISYAELDAAAEQLADKLASHEIDAGSLVGVHIARGPRMIEAILAVHKLGAAYLPLDPGYPESRLAQIVASARPHLIVTEEINRGLEAHQFSVRDQQFYQASDAQLPVQVATDAAYVIYTSGSTGAPKGVEVGHRSLCNYLDAVARQFEMARDDRVLQVTSLSFDIVVTEILAPLSIGASVVLTAPGQELDAAFIADLVETEGVSLVQMVPSMLSLLVDQNRKFVTVRRVLCGGEASSTALFQTAKSTFSNAKLTNVYGPTEATVWASAYDFSGNETDGTVSIGVPLQNISFYVLNQNQRPVNAGNRGELYIGGDALAYGYLHADELTQKAFVQIPGSAQRLYKTGDLVQQRPDGTFAFVGRTDSQVKVRGYRVELGEIEAQLNALGVQHAVCQLRDNRLIAFISNGEPNALSAELAQVLPDYMVPSLIIQLEQFPLTPNGKIDRRALADLEIGMTPAATEEPPQGEVEATLAEIWTDVLGLENIGRHANFFTIGGHSMLAIRVVTILREMLEEHVDVKVIFERPTIASLAAYLEEFYLQDELDGTTQ